MKAIKKLKKNLQKEEYVGKEFEKRYERKTIDKSSDKDYYKKILLETSEKNLKLVKKIPNRAKAMEYFDERIKTWGALPIENKGEKVIGYFCNFVPEEIIYAVDAIPVRLCSGFFESSDIVEEVLPRDICPLVKSCFGLEVLKFPVIESCDFIVIPTPCDAKKKLGEILSDYKPVWVLELPNSKDKPRAKDLWFEEVREFKKWVERITGKKITRRKLKKSINMLYERTKALRRLIDIRKLDPPVISERDYLIVIQTSFFTHAKEWTEKVNRLCDELEENSRKGINLSNGKRVPRIFLTGSPVMWPNFKILNLIEELDMIVVMDDLCSGTQHMYDPVEMDEPTMKDMMQAISERYLLPSVCPCFVSNDDRLDKISQFMEDFKIDGVIYHCLRLCQLFDLESNIVEHLMEKLKLPILKVNTDYSEEDKEQLRTRIEAFREMLRI
jgi:benzoyl-CoA reductase/2-hydroxyglutaryl-CoA dehydratase subunit BcrC/BadD/HgdB